MRIVRIILVASTLVVPLDLTAATSTILGWNNLGMHCMDSDYSVFTILPPYNTIEAQLIVGGRLVTNAAAYTRPAVDRRPAAPARERPLAGGSFGPTGPKMGAETVLGRADGG